MDRIVLASVDEFLAACAARGVRAAAMRVVDEMRPRRHEDGRVEIGPQRFVELFAYDAGIVLTALLREVPPAQIETALQSAGLKVRRRSGNLG